MSSKKRGLKDILADIDAEEKRFEERREAASRPKTQWFKVEAGKSVKVIFLQELDADSPNYSQKNDLGVLAIEHKNPEDFRRKALCTMDDEGACFGCEQHKKDYKAGWGQKRTLYINVLVDNGVDEPFVAVLSQGNGPKSITPALLEQAGEFPSITDTWYKVKRNGKSLSDTQYILTRLTDHGKNVEEYELFDLDAVIRDVPYAQQEAHYYGNNAPSAEEKEEAKELVESSPVGGNLTW